MKISFNNKWYPALIAFSSIAGIYIQTLNLLFDFSIVPLIHLLLSIAVIFSLGLLGYKPVKTVVKIWACLGIIGGGLGLISILLLHFIDRLEGGFDEQEIFRLSIHLIIGCLIFFFWSDSVNPETKAYDHEA